jgi:hypothetical protein
MGGYLYSLALAAVLVALVCTLVPESAVQHAKLLCSLCVIALLISPVMSLVQAVGQGAWEIPEAWQDGEQEEQDYAQLSDALVVGQLQVLLEREQGLPPKECRVLVEWGEDGGVKAVTLLLSGKAIWRDPDPIIAYVEGLLDCKCKVVLE